jgi:hypothetical protein
MRTGEPRNPPPDQSADHRDGQWRVGTPGTKTGRKVTTRALPAPGYQRCRQECSGRGLAAPATAPAAPPAGAFCGVV